MLKRPSQIEERFSFDSWSLVVAVNNDHIFKSTLLASPAIDSKCQVLPQRNFPSAGAAYNAGIAQARHEIVVFAHQDVFLPADWKTKIGESLSRLAEIDPNWGVIGVVGVEKNRSVVKGYCYSTGLMRFIGAPFSHLITVESLDEIVLIIRRSSGLTFDAELPGFHLYGTDVCLQARKHGMNSYAASAFCIHNTNGIRYFPVDFWRGYLYLRRKWWDYLPVQTCCTRITKLAGPALDSISRDAAHRLFAPRNVGSRWNDVTALSKMVSEKRKVLEAELL